MAVANPLPTVERLAQALISLAWLVESYGPQYIPLYEAMESWLAETRAANSTRDRIKRVLAENRSRVPLARGG